MARSKSKSKARSPQGRKPRSKPQVRRPRVLVLEGLSGSSRCVARAGGVGLTVTPWKSKTTLDMLYDAEWHALLLTGGSDVDPRRYGEKKIHKAVYGIDPVRDDLEFMALAEARKRNVPVLGICRGAQIMNVEAGGTLHQHIGRKHRYARHVVTTEAGSLLNGESGSKYDVVSLHHQAVKLVAPGWAKVAFANDGTVEAVESEDGRCLGVQFHPEEDRDAAYARGIFRWLVKEASKRSGIPVPEESAVRMTLPQDALPYLENIDLDDDWTLEDWLDYDHDKVIDELSSKRKHRQAGTRKMLPRAPVSYRFFCRCHGMEFDRLEDRDDHETMFGGEGK